MSQFDTTQPTTLNKGRTFAADQQTAGILVAYSPRPSVTVDRCIVSDNFHVGRAPQCALSVSDSKVSSSHFRIFVEEKQYYLKDLKSTNGTYVNGLLVSSREVLRDQTVIRAGRLLFVFHENVVPLLSSPPLERFGMAGRFHTGPLLRELNEVSLSSRHVLLSGASGTGKELAASALCQMMNEDGQTAKLLTHNAARFASQEEAEATLFGVTKRFFSNVDARPGLIEQSDGGVLFIDEAHNMPESVQRSLLRVIENGETTRLGETKAKPVRVRLILATNSPDETRGLAHDLFARLRLVNIPPLFGRLADIPTIFDTLLKNALTPVVADPEDVLHLLGADHYEALMLDGFPQRNVRGLVDLSDRLATRIASGSLPGVAIAEIFEERFRDNLVNLRRKQIRPQTNASRYEQNKTLILTTFERCDRNLSATERELKSMGFRCSRRWLSVFLKMWGFM